MKMEQLRQIDAFTNIMGCIENLYVWHYNADLQYIESSCPEPIYWDNIFQSSPSKAFAMSYCHENRLPLLLSSGNELLWILAPCYDQSTLTDIYVLGPVFISALSEHEIEQSLERHTMPLAFKREFMAHLKQIPTIIHSTFLLFGTMLHYCLTQERISISDIQISPSNYTLPQSETDPDVSSKTIHGGAAYEQLILNLIETGNLNYRSILNASQFKPGNVGILAPGSSIRQYKDEIIIATSLYSRAAIKGGLSRELALTISDQYIQAIEAASTIPEIATIYQLMHEDYTRRVHKCRQQSNLSTPVKSCIDLIDCCIFEPLNISYIAQKTGYAGYYLSSLFKKEIGISIGDYIKTQKIEYAKLLLINTNKNINEITEELNFSTPSKFTSVFRSITGTTPKEYRKQKGTVPE